MLKEFKEFAVKGNVVDMGVGIVIGAAFTSIVNSLVNDIINPIIGVITGGSISRTSSSILARATTRAWPRLGRRGRRP